MFNDVCVYSLIELYIPIHLHPLSTSTSHTSSPVPLLLHRPTSSRPTQKHMNKTKTKNKNTHSSQNGRKTEDKIQIPRRRCYANQLNLNPQISSFELWISNPHLSYTILTLSYIQSKQGSRSAPTKYSTQNISWLPS